MDRTRIKEILKKIEYGEITPEEGQEMIQACKQGIIPEIVPKTSAHSIPEEWSMEKPSIFRAFWLDGLCTVPKIHLRNESPKKPLPGQVVVAVKATAMNFMDLMCLSGMYPNLPEYPFVPGFECAGVVVAVGEFVTNVKVNDEVICLTDKKLGSHSTVICTDASLVYKKPSAVSFEETAAYSVAYLTEAHVFHLAQVQRGDYVLIHNAAGGCGHLAVQMAVERGAIVIATCGSESKFPFLEQLGARYCINYRTQDFEAKVMEITNQHGADVIINSLPQDGIQKGFHILAEGGRYVEIAIFGLQSNKQFDLSSFTHNQSFFSVNIRTVMYRQPELFQSYVKDMLMTLKERRYRICIDKVFTFEQIQEAYRYLSDRKNCGKIVIRNEYFDEILKYYHVGEASEVQQAQTKITRNQVEEEMAIIGISCRYADADTKEQLWKNLSEGICSVNEVPTNRWSKEIYYDKNRNNLYATDCKWGGFLQGIDEFDPRFFGMTGKDAQLTDPQQRMFLEEAWSALEDAGYASMSSESKSVGVYLGIGTGDYQEYMLSKNVPLEAQSFWGNTCSVAASRISYILNLNGPSIAVDTACSSSLVALHMACQSLKAGECEMALVGGAFTMVTPKFYIMCSNAGMLSNTGECSAFSQDANGFVPGEGISAILVKPLSKAKRDHDHIYAVIKGSGVNQDGKTNGLTAPSALSQSKLECSVYDQYHINPETISYIETHGTGTPLGDSIEIQALQNTFSKYTKKSHFCALGSIKPNVGHTSMAAGLAGVIKIAMSMKHKQIPPQIHCERLNHEIEIEESPFYIPKEMTPWEIDEGQVRRAAVSSFGFGGVNAHTVLEEYVENQTKQVERPYYLFVFSAKGRDSLKQYLTKFLAWMKEEGKNESLYEIAYTLQARRYHFHTRYALIAKDREELIELLAKSLDETLYHESKKSEEMEMMRITNSNDAMAYYEDLKKQKEYFEQGCQMDWNRFDENQNAHTVSLPTYAFATDRYWFEEVSNEASIKKETTKKETTKDKLLQLFQEVKENKLNVSEAEERIESQMKDVR